jgi:hypothetical protein
MAATAAVATPSGVELLSGQLSAVHWAEGMNEAAAPAIGAEKKQRKKRREPGGGQVACK